MKHRVILAEIERCLNTIPGLQVKRDVRQPEDHEDLRQSGPVAILYSGERNTAEIRNGSALTWARRWELKPRITVFVANASEDVMREQLEDIEAAFVAALEDSRLQQGDLLAGTTAPEFMTKFHHPDESDLCGMEMFLNLTYDR